MAGIEMVRRNRQIRIRDYAAAIRERDPQRCWIFQSLIDYNDFKRLLESTCEQDSNDVTVEEFLTKKRTLKFYKNRRKQTAPQALEARLSVAKPSHAGSCGTLGGLKPSDSVSGVHEPVVGVGEAEKKRKGLEVAKPSVAGPSGGPGWLRQPGLVSRVQEPVVGADKGEGVASEMALANPMYREVLECSTNRNPAEFSTETAESFMRRIMS